MRKYLLTAALTGIACASVAPAAHAAPKPQLPASVQEFCERYGEYIDFGDPTDEEPGAVCTYKTGDRISSYSEGSGVVDFYDYDDLKFLSVEDTFVVAAEYGDDSDLTVFATEGGSKFYVNECVRGEARHVKVRRAEFLERVEEEGYARSFTVDYDAKKDRGIFTLTVVLVDAYSDNGFQAYTCGV